MIFQHHNLVKRLSVLKNVLVGRMAGLSSILCAAAAVPRARCRDRDGVPASGSSLTHKALMRADQLSGGEQQRVGIARALAQNPAVILADEPVASLDPKTSRVVLGYLKRICKETGIAVICNLHQVDYAVEFGERIVGLSRRHGDLRRRAGGADLDVVHRIYPGLDDPGIGAHPRVDRAAGEPARRRPCPHRRRLKEENEHLERGAPTGHEPTRRPHGLVGQSHPGRGRGGHRPSLVSAQGAQINLEEPRQGRPLHGLTSSYRMMPPNFGFMEKLWKPALESLYVAIWGTIGGVGHRPALHFFAARNLAPNSRLPPPDAPDPERACAASTRSFSR